MSNVSHESAAARPYRPVKAWILAALLFVFGVKLLLGARS